MMHNRYLPLWLHRVCNGVFGTALLVGISSIWFGEPAGSWRNVVSRCLIWSSIPIGIILALVTRRFSIVQGVAGEDGYDELHVMDAARSLTEFQQKCEVELCSALAARGLALTDRVLAGESETYIRAAVRGTDIVVYIYEDEAQFHKDGKRAGTFEHQDFNDSTELQRAFIRAVVEATVVEATQTTPASPFQRVIKSAVIQQVLVLVLASMILDGGVVAEVCLFAAAAFWTGVALIRFRRRTPTKLDLMLIEGGYIVLCVIAFFLAHLIWHLRGMI